MTLIKKQKLAKSKTKFKGNIPKMYYYGTKEEADAFVEELEKCFKEK